MEQNIWRPPPPILFPNFHFNQELMTRANSELVDVSQRGQTSPSVSIIAARQVSLSDPHGGPPFWIRGDAPLPLWPLESSRGHSRIWHRFRNRNSLNIISQTEWKPHKVERVVNGGQRGSGIHIVLDDWHTMALWFVFQRTYLIQLHPKNIFPVQSKAFKIVFTQLLVKKQR